MATPGTKPDLNGPSDNLPEPSQAGGRDAVRNFPPPEHLSERGKELWTLLIPDLAATGVYRASDALMLTMFVELYVSAEQFLDALKRENQIDPTSQEAKRARSGLLECLNAATKIAAEFGLAPVARLRLGLMKAQGATLLGKLGVKVADE